MRRKTRRDGPPSGIEDVLVDWMVYRTRRALKEHKIVHLLMEIQPQWKWMYRGDPGLCEYAGEKER